MMNNEENESKKLISAFCCIRDIYRNCSRMLLSCEPILNDERGYTAYNWASVYGYNSNINNPDSWLFNWVIRQFYPIDQPVSKVEGETLYEILTVGAIPWRKINPDNFEPMCMASRLWATGTPDAIYHVSVMQMYEDIPKTDGKVHIYGEELDFLDNFVKQKFKELVKDNRLISIAVPLFEITNTDELFNRVINPLLEHEWPLKTK